MGEGYSQGSVILRGGGNSEEEDKVLGKTYSRRGQVPMKARYPQREKCPWG